MTAIERIYSIIIAAIAILLLDVPTAEALPISVPFSRIADTGTPIPGGTGTFRDFGGFSVGPSLRDGVVAFDAEGSSGQQGIYKSVGGSLTVVADKTTAIPGGAGTFTGFGSPSTSRGDLSFRGFGTADQTGVYTNIAGTLDVVADTNTSIPNAAGNFAAFSHFYSFSAGNVAFCGLNAAGQVTGEYSDLGGKISVIADLNTSIPSGSGNFVDFAPFTDIDAGNVAFVGFGAGQKGLYTDIGGLHAVADTNTPVPGGLGDFSDFGSVSLSSGNLAFKGVDSSGEHGIYTDIGGLSLVADTNTIMPGEALTFDNFGFGLFTGPSLSNGRVAFLGFDSAFQTGGIFTNIGDTLNPVITHGDFLDGRVVRGLLMSPEALDGNMLAFQAFFEDGSSGVYVGKIAVVPEPSTLSMVVAGLIILIGCKVRPPPNSRSADLSSV